MASNIEIQDEDDDEEEDDEVNYANVETRTKRAQRKHPRKTRPVRRRRQYRLVVLGFGLLCGVQALLNIGLRLSLYSEWTEEKNSLTKDLDHLQSKYDNLTKDLDQMTEQKDQIQSGYEQLQSKYDTLIKDLDQMTEITELKRRLCEPHGFTLSGGRCYYISTERKTWEESRQYCIDKQSELMTINSKEEQDYVKRNKGGGDVWLGLTDSEEEGEWKWVDGKALTSPTYWAHDEPDNSREADCVVSSGSDGFWFDAPCSSNKGCICERVI